MPDDMDFCQQINQELIDDALADHCRRRLHGESSETCLDCGEEIPQARRAAVRGCCRCYGCQAAYENRF